jgi:hypothetical protein
MPSLENLDATLWQKSTVPLTDVRGSVDSVCSATEIRKMLQCSLPPGYERKKPLGIIEEKK